MRLNFGREGFIFFSFYRFQKIYPDNTIIEFPVILNQHKRKQKKRFPVKLIRFGKPRDFLDYQKINTPILEFFCCTYYDELSVKKGMRIKKRRE